jgi:hypothetical protein
MRNANYADLKTIVEDMNKLKKNFPGVHFLMKEKIDRFFKLNHPRIKMLTEKTNELVKIFVLHDEKNNPIVIDSVYQFETEEKKTEYLKQLNEFLFSVVFDIQH